MVESEIVINNWGKTSRNLAKKVDLPNLFQVQAGKIVPKMDSPLSGTQTPFKFE